MTKDEAIAWLKLERKARNEISKGEGILPALDMAINALKADIVRCEDCKYQNECEEIVLFDINDDEVMGHRVYWCSYGRSE